MHDLRLELLDEIYGTIGQPEAWPTICRRLAEATEGAASIFVQGSSSSIEEGFSHGYDPAYVESYRRHYARLNMFVPLVMHQPKGRIVPCTEVVDRAEFEKTEFAADWALPQGWQHYAMAAIDADGGRGVLLAVTRQGASRSYTAEDLLLLDFIIPHIRRVIGLGLRLSGSQAAGHHTGDVLNQLGFAAFTLSRSGSVLAMNDRAGALAEARVHLQVRNGAIHMAGGGERLLRSIRNVADSGIGTSILIGEGPQALQATLVPQPQPTTFPSLGRSVMLLIKDKAAEASAADPLRQAFHLTPAETRLLLKLACGASVASYCEEAGLSRNTVKTQLRNLFAKTGTSRQADLVRLVLAGAGSQGRHAP